LAARDVRLQRRPGAPAGSRLKSVAGVLQLTRRIDFLYIAKGAKAARPTLVAQARLLPRVIRDTVRGPAIGFTATRKIGGAVVRNRAKRRLKEAARALIAQHGRAGAGYVFVARESTADAPWPALLDDMKSALIRLAALLDAGDAAGPP
jgi:ribonuclease P protein component